MYVVEGLEVTIKKELQPAPIHNMIDCIICPINNLNVFAYMYIYNIYKRANKKKNLYVCSYRPFSPYITNKSPFAVRVEYVQSLSLSLSPTTK